MTVMAAASVAVTLVLAPGLRPERPGQPGEAGEAGERLGAEGDAPPPARVVG
jgi:hypothetical protein